ncbi:MAG: heavy metal-binding domain-containing protein [Bryobacteraceae bacterium]
MKRRCFLGAVGAATLLHGQAPDPNTIFICPMDPDVRSHDPGTCPRCGMKLASGLPEPTEYHLDLTTTPRALRPGKPVNLSFAVTDPWKHRPVTKFQVVHEKLFHMFVVSQDLEFFLHDHPVFSPDGQFHYDNLILPKAGMYRVLSDFYPDAATPQLITKTLLVPGNPPAPMQPSPVWKTDTATLRTVPERPIAAMNTQLHFTLTPGDGLQPYLGTWAHMLVASDDLIDMIHLHPFIADGGPEIQFNATLPRPGHAYRVWIQYQRNNVVHTERFDVTANHL